MSLADELLADLEDGGEEELEAVEADPTDVPMDVGDMPASEAPEESVKSIAKLLGSEQLSDVMEQIEYFSKLKGKRQVSGLLEADPEYQLIIEANNVTVEIDNEISVIHKYVRDLYYKRFPELESLVPLAVEYMKTVKELGNDIDQSKNSEVLHEILTPATIMVVSVTASTTQGKLLTPEEINRTIEACDMALDLLKHKTQIFDYVESRMSFISPNLAIVVGASSAAKLMGIAGGLTNLSKMPACNVLVLGAQKKTLSGFSSTQIQPHTGYVYFTDLVQKIPQEMRKKAARLVAAKCTLAARVDAFHESQDGKVGDTIRGEIEAKLEKWQEPPPVKAIKALPIPLDAARKKRGGRRYRKMKERLGMTDMRRAANRMNFGEIEEDAYQDDLGVHLGTAGKSRSGHVRGPPVDSKTKARISKTLQQKLHKQNQVWGGSTTVKKHVSGTSSSVAFTPLQGLEIVNPQAGEGRSESSQKYFSPVAGFRSIKPK